MKQHSIRARRTHLPKPIGPDTHIGRLRHPSPYRGPSDKLQRVRTRHLRSLLRQSHRTGVFPSQHARGLHPIFHVPCGHARGFRLGLCLPPPNALFPRVVRLPALYRLRPHPHPLKFRCTTLSCPTSQGKLGLDHLAPGRRCPKINEGPCPPPLPISHSLAVWFDINLNKISPTLALHTPLKCVTYRSKPSWTTMLSTLRKAYNSTLRVSRRERHDSSLLMFSRAAQSSCSKCERQGHNLFYVDNTAKVRGGLRGTLGEE